MNEKNNFTVLLIGFSNHATKLFRSIATLTKGRSRTYRLADNQQDRADILVVNGDDPGAVKRWRELCDSVGDQACLLVSRTAPRQAGAVHIRPPLIFTRVVAALDQIAAQSLKSAPDLVIEQGAEVPSELESMLARMSRAAPKQPLHRALVVDDSPSVRKLMEIELRLSKIAGDFAESADEAWQLLSSETYDIIFLDVVLPGVDGYQICKSIKKDKSMKDTPVIMLTGKSSPFDRVRGKLAGCNSYLVKPAPHEALQEVFQRYLPAEDNRMDPNFRGAAVPSFATG